MISVDEALDKILSQLGTLEAEEKNILDCLGQVVAEDIYAPFNVPANNNSAMDGYALKTRDIKGADSKHPKMLKVIGEIPAGFAPNIKIKSGECVRIMTGGIIPEDADVVIPIELTDIRKRKKYLGQESEIGIYEELEVGTNIRKIGEDMHKGELIVNSGKLLRPAEVGVIASIGRNKVSVIRRPVISIIATGNELVDISNKLSTGKIYNSNSYALASQVLQFGGIPQMLGIARDNVKDLTRSFQKGLNCDLLITSGGVSVGEYDFVKKALMIEGEMAFWQVRMKPGKPIAFGFISKNGNRIPHLGLPGNPVSCMIGLEIFGGPSILKMMGRQDYIRDTITTIMEDKVLNNDGRRIYVRVIVEKKNNKCYARLTGSQGSAILTSMVKANGLGIIPETCREVRKGDTIEVILLDGY